MSYAADDTQAIAQRLKELQAEKDEALRGTSAPVTGQEEKTEDQSHMYGIPYGYGSQAYVVNVPLKSTAHPEWPYAGTAHEWRGFVTNLK